MRNYIIFLFLCVFLFSCNKKTTNEIISENIISDAKIPMLKNNIPDTQMSIEYENKDIDITQNIDDNIISLEIEAKVIRITDYVDGRQHFSALFLDETNDNIPDKVLHIANTGNTLTRNLISEGDIVKYESGEHVIPQWEYYAQKLYDNIGITSNYIVDIHDLLEINNISILSFFDYETDDWKESFFPYAYLKYK